MLLLNSDYYPFGSPMPERSFSTPSYRYGFQGQEKDDEVKGEGNSVNYKYRMHDARLGRFFAVDPLASKYPYNSPYAFSENRVIDGVELEGLEFSKAGFHSGMSGMNFVNGSGKNNKPILTIDTYSLVISEQNGVFQYIEKHNDPKDIARFKSEGYTSGLYYRYENEIRGVKEEYVSENSTFELEFYGSASLDKTTTFGPVSTKIPLYGYGVSNLSGITKLDPSKSSLSIESGLGSLSTNTKGEISGSLTIPYLSGGPYKTRATVDLTNEKIKVGIRGKVSQDVLGYGYTVIGGFKVIGDLEAINLHSTRILDAYIGTEVDRASFKLFQWGNAFQERQNSEEGF